ncbi:MAG: DsbA family protein [Candidatus Binataceae bacterium]|jgi:predicted DsbA family dithiol-disulfide isomerase
MAKVIIPIYFDYASTLCYVAWRIVRELERELPFVPLWKGVPIRLRDGRSRPSMPLATVERMKVMTAIAETGVAVTPLESWIDSSAALEGAELAREAGALPGYHERVFRAAFEARGNIARLDLLAQMAADCGLDPARFRADLEAHRMAPAIAANKEEADRCSALGYPAFILGDFPLIGIQPIATMRLLLRRYIDQRSQERPN